MGIVCNASIITSKWRSKMSVKKILLIHHSDEPIEVDIKHSEHVVKGNIYFMKDNFAENPFLKDMQMAARIFEHNDMIYIISELEAENKRLKNELGIRS